jgi:hypothetical protein
MTAGLPDGLFLKKFYQFKRKILVYFMTIWNILRPSGILNARLL